MLNHGETSLPQESFRPENIDKFLPGSRFWQILTGTQNPVGLADLDSVVNPSGEVHELSSELFWNDLDNNNIDGEIILGVTARELLPNSITGITDSLRIIVLTPEAMVEAKKRLTQNIQATELTGLGMLVKNSKMKGVEIEHQNKVYYDHPVTGKKNAIKSSIVDTVKPIEIEGQMLLIEADKLRTPLDLLHLCDQIDATDPKAGKEFALNLLAKLGITALNAKNWQEVLQNYQLPAEMSEQTATALTEIKERILANTGQILDTFVGLAQRVTNNADTKAEDLSKLDLIKQHLVNLDQNKYREATQERIKRRLDSLVLRLARRWEGRTGEIRAETPKARLEQLGMREKEVFQGEKVVQEERPKLPRDAKADRETDLARLDKLINLGIDGAMQLNAWLSGRLGENDSKTWLLSTLVERSQRILIQKMPVTQAMKEDYKSRTGKELAEKATIIEYLASLEAHPDRIILEEGKAKLAEIEKIALQTAEQTAEYEQTKVKLRDKTDEICEKLPEAVDFHLFPEHPFADEYNWQQLMDIIDSVSNQTVKEKLKSEYEAKRQIVLAQANLTNLLLDMIGHPSLLFFGGLEGWTESKKELETLAETSIVLQIYLKESNCVGRMILLSGMLLLARIFSETEVIVGSTYSHAFLGAKDPLHVQRKIEASSYRKHSFFEQESREVVSSNVLNKPAIVTWLSLEKGLLYNLLNNYLGNTEQTVKLEIFSNLINITNGRDEGLWMTLSSCFDYYSLAAKVSIFRAGEMGNFYDKTFWDFNFNTNTRNIIEMIESNQDSPLLPWLKKSLLVMQRNLGPANQRSILVDKIEKLITSKGHSFNATILRANLQAVIEKLKDVPLPPGWSDDVSTWSQEDIWNPELFLKASLNDQGNLQWQIPQQTPNIKS